MFIDGGETLADAALELAVRTADAGIDDVGVHALAGTAVVIFLIQRQRGLVDTVQTPGRAALGGERLDHRVLLDKAHAVVGRQALGLGAVHAAGEADEGLVVDEVRAAAIDALQFLHQAGGLFGAGVAAVA